MIGYSAQGFGKFGFYEIFKDVYKGAFGKSAEKYQTIGFLASSACAEVIADCFLAPWEAVSYRSFLLFRIYCLSRANQILIIMVIAESKNANL